ncbi:UNKNOWN [Stylonychia lemnae]|uniref:Uncharacterized protein n=1 Tax=Stylonychia lemnae TaxID=5949 RepID=A0A078AUA2_STYLE|nr:UNKNOWN [Stylonychia lemnae]|eukprot:CDW84418.1 UNKNOWN [Stylonychia lemnae]
MGSCSSGPSKETEIDLFLQKHHKLGQVHTDKNAYEVSKQQFDPKLANMVLQQLGDQYLINDEIEKRSKLRQGMGDFQEDLILLSASTANMPTSHSNNAYGSEQSRLGQPKGTLTCTVVQEDAELNLQGEYGTGGRPFIHKVPNPYLEVDLIDPSDPILFQGELQKFKPGFNGVFIDRWVQVTRKALRYFANKPGSQLAAGKPLMAFPIIAIKNIEKIDLDIKLKKTDKKGQELQKNMFEIYLKDDFLDIFLRSDYEQLFAPDTKRRNHILQQIERESKNYSSPGKKNLKELYQSEMENKPEEPLKQAAMSTLNTHSGAWSNRQGMWPLSDRKMIFACKKEIVTKQWLDNLIAVANDVNRPVEEQQQILNEIENDVEDVDNGPVNGTINNNSMSLENSPNRFS